MLIFLWILAVITVAAAGYFAYRADKKRAVSYPLVTAVLRALVVALVWALLLAPSIQISKTETENPVIVFLQDASASIPPALKGDTLSYGKAARSLIQKLSTKYRVVTWGFGNHIAADSPFNYTQTGTDIAAPLARVQDYFGNQNLGAVILASDGRFNSGLHPLYQNLALHSPVYTVSMGDTSLPKDLKVTQIYANKRVSKDAQIEIRADLVATRCAGYSGQVQLLEGNASLASTPISINAPRFDKQVSFTIKAGTPGLHHYVVYAPTAKDEQNVANNRKDVFIEVVESKKKILIATAAPHPDIAAIRAALSETDAYSVTVANSIPEEYGAYDVLILHGLPKAGSNLSFKNKAVWYILTPGSGSINTDAATLQLNPAMPHDAYAAANTSFSTFRLPDGLNAVLDKLPPLSIATGTATPGAGTQVLFSDRNTKSPIWMIQSGNAPQALLLGEGLWRWRLYEYRFFRNHNIVDELIRQTVASLATNVSDAPFRVSIPKYEWSDGERISLDAYLTNAAGEQINTPDAALEIMDSAGKKQRFSFEKNGAAYRLNLGSMPAGSYRYSASTNYNGKKLESSGAFVVSSIPIEAMEQGSDYPLLYNLAKKYGGSTVASPQIESLYDSISKNENIKPILRERATTVPLVDWKWYFFLILLVATIEWLLRKYWLAQ